MHLWTLGFVAFGFVVELEYMYVRTEVRSAHWNQCLA
jgi:hypothetical protein